MVAPKTEEEIELMRENAILVSKTLAEVGKMVAPGVTTLELNRVAETFIRDNGAIPSFLGFDGFPAALCMSVNDVVVHGFPSDYVLRDGDIVSVACGTYYRGYNGDSAYTFPGGEVDAETAELLKVTKESLYKGIAAAVDGARVGDIGHAVQSYAESFGFGVVRELEGHGIGTQMHLSCSMNDNELNNRKKYITQMFKLMAQSGKLCRVSEFDMGMDDKNGNSVSTANMTEEMHQRMADYYEWIVKQYLTIIPPEQQWGICHWCPTDSPAGSGWRANTPVGIWDINYYRKHAYAGFVRGFGGVVSGIETVNEEEPIVKKGIYDLSGRRISEGTDISTLPAGFYIVNGKKMVKK